MTPEPAAASMSYGQGLPPRGGWKLQMDDPRCTAVTTRGTRCTRSGTLRRVPWLNNEWRCFQHGG